MAKRIPKQSKRRRTGAIVVMVAISLPLIVVMLALMIDTNWMMLTTLEAQSAADLSTLGTMDRHRTFNVDGGISQRETAAKEVGKIVFEANSIGGRSRAISSADILLGDIVGGDFQVSTNPVTVTAAHVDTSQLAGMDTPLFLAPTVFGVPSFVPRGAATRAVPHLEIVLCMDASRSMTLKLNSSKFPRGGGYQKPPLPGSRWMEIIDSVQGFLDVIEARYPSARVSLVTYGGGTTFPNPKYRSKLDEEPARIETSLLPTNERDKITAVMHSYATDYIALAYGTEPNEGIRASLEVLATSQNRDNVQQAIILLGDGLSPKTDENIAIDWARDAGVSIHSVLVSNSSNAVSQLKAYAQGTGGVFIHAKAKKKVDAAFLSFADALKTRLVE